jgi:hypothetical protein
MTLAVSNIDLQNWLRPVMLSLAGLAGVVCTLFIIIGGFHYMTSAGRPDKLEQAKKILRNAILGLIVVFAAATITTILTNAYRSGNSTNFQAIPSLEPVKTSTETGGVTEILLNAMLGLFRHITETAAQPFISALSFFTEGTPLMAQNQAVFRLWLTMVGIANALFVLLVAILGFHIMSATSLGFEELELKQLLPRLAFTFLGMNISIYIVDFIISISNAMIDALNSAYNSLSVWDALLSVASEASLQGFVSLLIMIVFLVLAVLLVIYYIMRIVTLYVGAVLSPLTILISALPGFRDFSMTAIKVYITSIFVLFVHIVILMLAATLFAGLKVGDDKAYDPVMTTVVGVATLLALLKTQGLLMQLSYVSVGPRALRKLGTQFMHGMNYTSSKLQSTRRVASGFNQSSEGSRKPVRSNKVKEF